MSNAAWSNAISCVLTDTPFIEDLAVSVTNDGDLDGAARWLLSILVGDDRNPIAAFDAFHPFIEGLGRAWPVMRMAAEMFEADCAHIARFIAERIQAASDDRVALGWFNPATQAIVIAERAHDIAGFFSIGLKPNGSKDPYALRRSAKHFIIAAALLPKNRSAP